MTPRFMLTLALFGLMASASASWAAFHNASQQVALPINEAEVSDLIKRSSIVSEEYDSRQTTIDSVMIRGDFNASLNPPPFVEWTESTDDSSNESATADPGSEFLKRLIDTTQ